MLQLESLDNIIDTYYYLDFLVRTLLFYKIPTIKLMMVKTFNLKIIIFIRYINNYVL